MVSKLERVGGGNAGAVAGLTKTTADATYAWVVAYDVRKYGAIGDGTTDDTTAIQAAIDDLPNEGGVVAIPAGTWRLAAPLTIRSNTILQGAGENVTTIKQASTTANGIVGVDLAHVGIRDLRVVGPGDWTGTGTGIKFSLSGNAGNATFYVHMTNVRIEQFGVDGINIQTPIVTHLERVVPFRCGRHGIYLWATGDIAGTSTTLTSCFPAGNHGAGVRLEQMAYCTLNACAGDANGIAYDYHTCYGITENSCGSEEPYDFSAFQAGYTGQSRRLINTRAVLNGPYAISNVGTAYDIGANSVVTINSPYEGSPGQPDSPTNNPTNSLLVAPGAKVWLNGESFVTPMNLASGTTRRGGIVLVSQAEYDALTPDPATVYVVS